MAYITSVTIYKSLYDDIYKSKYGDIYPNILNNPTLLHQIIYTMQYIWW